MPTDLFLIQEYNENKKKTSVTIPRCELLSLLHVKLCLVLKCDSTALPHNFLPRCSTQRSPIYIALYPSNFLWSCIQNGRKRKWKKQLRNCSHAENSLCTIMANAIALVIKWRGMPGQWQTPYQQNGQNLVLLLLFCSFSGLLSNSHWN